MTLSCSLCSRTDPEYYDIVTQPIDLLKIQHKLRSEEYDDIDQLSQDVELMVNNAKAFYSVSTAQSTRGRSVQRAREFL